LPSITSLAFMGRVISNSKVPRRLSSAQSRMLTAGTKKMRNQGRLPKKLRRSAMPPRKNPVMKRTELNARKAMMKM